MPRPADSPRSARPEYAGQYRLESVLGSGGMGVVHLATSASGLRLAVKVVHAEFAADPEFRARFRQEVTAARRVSGAFTAAVVDADPEAGRPWMATLFVDGPTLAQRTKRKPLDAAELNRLGAGLAEALRDIHRAGLVHRDLKPGNVLMAGDGPKVIDFGISRPYDSQLRTETGKLIGTPPFMAPEQFQRPREVGPEADVFAMGAVLVHAATGRGPFDSDSPYLVAYQVVHHEPDLSGVPEELVPLIARCLAKAPEDRPTTDELIAELRSAAYPTAEDTRAFIPAPRVPGEGGVPGRGHGWGLPAAGERADRGPGAAPGSADGSGPGREEATHRRVRIDVSAEDGRGRPSRPSPAPRASRTSRASASRGRLGPWSRRRRGAAAGGAAVLVAAVAAGAVLIGGYGDGDGGPGAGRRTAAGPGALPGAVPGWSVPLVPGGGMPACSAAGGAVYCAGPRLAAARLDRSDGTVRWKVPGSPSGDRVGGEQAPVLAGGLVHLVSADGRTLRALDPETGRERWSAPVPAGAGPVHAGRGRETVLLGTADGRVRALDSASGKRLWSRSVGGVGTVFTGSGTDGTVFAVTAAGDGATTEVRALDAVDGTERWRLRTAGQLTAIGATGGGGTGTGGTGTGAPGGAGGLYLLGSDLYGVTDAVVRIDLRTRAVRRLAPAAPVDQAQGAVDADGTVYLSGFSGDLTAVGTGPDGALAERWRLETLVSRVSRPVPAGAYVYLSTADGRVLAVTAKTGRTAGRTEVRGGDRTLPVPTLPAPVVGGGRVVAVTPEGSVFSVGSEPKGW
ncbi:serine/threonine-protein kinase [Streptomyces sp. NPDC097619]|uniref:serine/threonine-protein kinase n=1 Tax=Streptomyces sp. NPDC097619 TaxID=3157228 RepID=UPI003323CFD1